MQISAVEAHDDKEYDEGNAYIDKKSRYTLPRWSAVALLLMQFKDHFLKCREENQFGTMTWLYFWNLVNMVNLTLVSNKPSVSKQLLGVEIFHNFYVSLLFSPKMNVWRNHYWFNPIQYKVRGFLELALCQYIHKNGYWYWKSFRRIFHHIYYNTLAKGRNSWVEWVTACNFLSPDSRLDACFHPVKIEPLVFDSCESHICSVYSPLFLCII